MKIVEKYIVCLNVVLKQWVLLAFILLLVGVNSQAQTDVLYQASKAYSLKQLKEAKTLIDSASVHPSTNKNPQTWLYRGFIYKDLYKNEQSADKNSPYREEAMQAYLTYFKYAPEDEPNMSQATASYKFLVSKYQNDAAASITPKNYKQAEKNYKEFLKYTKLMFPDTNLMQEEIDFHLVLAGVFQEAYEKEKKDKTFFTKAEDEYNYILQLDSNHYSAHYNLGLLYYNEGVDKIYGEGFVDIIELQNIQESAIEMFRRALPYMQKAYEMRSERKETILGLSGIYAALNEYEKQEELDKKLKEIEENK